MNQKPKPETIEKTRQQEANDNGRVRGQAWTDALKQGRDTSGRLNEGPERQALENISKK